MSGTPRLVPLLAALAGLGIACGEEGAPPRAAAPVVLAEVEARDLEDRIQASGELRARERAEVAVEVAGRITEILRDEGDRVEAGEVVVAIDPERRQLGLQDARAGVTEAEAALNEEERESRRIRKLNERGVASQARLDQAETNRRLALSRRDAARARLGVAERALRDASVKAPFAGVIARRAVSRGEFVQPGALLFELVALDPIEVEFHLAEADSGRVRVGDEVRVTVAPFPDEVIPARVTLVAPTIDPRTRTLRVRAEIANPDGRLRPGLFARADLGLKRRARVPMIPEEAVLQRADGAVVFRELDGNHVERLVIETGVHRDGAVEVVRGLAVGDRVVARGHHALIDGALVSPRAPDGAPIPAGTDVAGDAPQ